MRRIVYYLTTSLDGFVARADGSIEWLVDDEAEDYGYPEFIGGIDTVVLGRKTYEQCLTFGPYPYADKKSYVFSSSLSHADHAEIVNGSVEEFAARQRELPGGDIWLVGGGELAGAFFAAHAIDDVVVFVQPILLGEGLPMAGHLDRDVKLRWKSSETFKTGLVRIDYEVQ